MPSSRDVRLFALCGLHRRGEADAGRGEPVGRNLRAVHLIEAIGLLYCEESQLVVVADELCELFVSRARRDLLDGKPGEFPMRVSPTGI